MEAALTAIETPASARRMGRKPLHMKEIKVQFPAEVLEQVDALVGDKHRSKFIRAAVEGALATASQVKQPAHSDDK